MVVVELLLGRAFTLILHHVLAETRRKAIVGKLARLQKFPTTRIRAAYGAACDGQGVREEQEKRSKAS